MSSLKNYTTPKLFNNKGDIKKDWYVYFYYTDNLSGKKKQFRYKAGINRLKSKRKREELAISMCEALVIKLENGWNPITDKTEEAKSSLLLDALDEVLARKESYLTKSSLKSYFFRTRLFKEWLVKAGYSHLYANHLTQSHMRQYFDYVLEVRKNSGKTFNSHLATLSVYFNDMLERGVITESPLKGIKQVKEEVGKMSIYSDREEAKLDKLMREDNFEFYMATRFIRYCFLRRTELANLKVKHINWQNKTVTIPSSSAKSRVQDSVTIPTTLEKLIEKSGYLELDPELYLFGKNFTPSETKIKKLDYFTEQQKMYNEKLKIKTECTFYSWKHTGTVDLYNLTKDVYVVMRQCRHSDIQTTMIYLRSLGCGVNEQVRGW